MVKSKEEIEVFDITARTSYKACGTTITTKTLTLSLLPNFDSLAPSLYSSDHKAWRKDRRHRGRCNPVSFPIQNFKRCANAVHNATKSRPVWREEVVGGTACACVNINWVSRAPLVQTGKLWRGGFLVVTDLTKKFQFQGCLQGGSPRVGNRKCRGRCHEGLSFSIPPHHLWNPGCYHIDSEVWVANNEGGPQSYYGA